MHGAMPDDHDATVNGSIQRLTWAALLGQWVRFAQSALALPDDAEGRAWKAAVPAIIALQAVCMALRDAHRLPPDERALGLDRARILLEKHSAELHRLFANGPLHPMLRELIADAELAIRDVASAP